MIRTCLSRLSRLAVSLASLAASGCMVGPDFQRPPPPDTGRYEETTDPVRLGAPGARALQIIASGADLPAAWETLFRSRELDRLVRRGLAANPTIAEAEAALRQAQAATDASRAGLYPTVSTNLSRGASGTIGRQNPVFGIYGASISANYTLDLFGGIRRSIEASDAQTDASLWSLRAAQLALTANIVASAIQEASITEQIKVSEAILRRYREQLTLVKVRSEQGAETITSVLTQESLIRTQNAGIVALRNARAQTRHRLAILIGEAPSAYAAPGFLLAGLPLPRRLPVVLPSQLVGRRPDIRVAEAQLHAASAAIGVATANLYPSISISSSLSASSPTLASFAASNAWSTAAGLAQPIFDGGALQAQRRVAIAGYEEAFAAYKAVVLAALQNVADALSALDADARILTATTQAEDLARRSLAAAEIQYAAGGLSYSNLLIAQSTYAGATLTRLQAQVQRLTDTAALFQVVGGRLAASDYP